MMAIGPHPCGDLNRETYLLRTWLERSKQGWLTNTRSHLLFVYRGSPQRLDLARADFRSRLEGVVRTNAGDVMIDHDARVTVVDVLPFVDWDAIAKHWLWS